MFIMCGGAIPLMERPFGRVLHCYRVAAGFLSMRAACHPSTRFRLFSFRQSIILPNERRTRNRLHIRPCAATKSHQNASSDRLPIPYSRDISLRLFVLCFRSLLTHRHNSCWAEWPAQVGRIRKAGRGKSMKLKLPLLYSIHVTYGGVQMTEMQ